MHLMGAHNHCPAQIALLNQNILNHLRIHWIKRCKRFVNDNEIWFVNQGCDQLRLLLHAFRKCFNFFLPVAFQIETFEIII